MKLFLRILCTACVAISTLGLNAQCGTGYSQAQLNWDNLDYYYNSTDPYGSFVSNVQAQTQRFTIGTTSLTMATSNAGIINGENGNHTGNLSGYAGDDAQFTPSSNVQTITITFARDVQNVRFALYDIDGSSRFDIDAFNSSNVGQNVSITRQGTTNLTVSNNNSINAYVSSSSNEIGNGSNRGTATVTISGTVRRVEITVTNRGTDPVFWLSDINACVSGSFPVNYHQSVTRQPFIGQPDYVLVTPDNNSVYIVDPVSGRAKLLFTDTEKQYINSLAYDARNQLLYYISENASINSSNKTLKRYNLDTETISVVLSNISTALNIPTFTNGVESGGAAFYDGALYFGIEGGSSSTRENIIFRIDFAADGITPVSAAQVRATPASSNGTSIHDWADFTIKDGVLYDFNGAFGGTSSNRTYTNSSIAHYDLMGQNVVDNYINPTSSQFWAGQAALDWAGNLYSFWWNSNSGGSGGIRRYNEDGSFATSVPITIAGGIWPGGAGDACESFRPKADFGDAPASYDPDLRSPAVHEMDPNLRLGNSFDREWDKKVSSLSDADNDDDGLPFARILNLSGGNYQTDLNVFNNTGEEAMVCAWIDFNANGTFEAGEGIELVVPSSSTTQQVSLYWPSISANLPANSYTVMRIRITSRANGMTRSNTTGYYANGEVEDYRIIVNATTLAVRNVQFDAVKEKEAVKLQWKVDGDKHVINYKVERSSNGLDWTTISTINANNEPSYKTYDNSPLSGRVHYRLRIETMDGKFTYSNSRIVQFDLNRTSLQIVTNPVKNTVVLNINAVENGAASVIVMDMNGQQLLRRQINVQKGVGQHTISVEQLSTGQYILHYTQNRFTDKKTFIVVK